MARVRGQSEPGTSTRILDAAERLAQRRGFNGFSYADIASELGITTASLHYHFPTKAALGQALIQRYSGRFAEELAAIDGRFSTIGERLDAYANLYATVLAEGRFCLCGMLAAEYDTLPEAMRAAVIAFFDQNEAWLTQELEIGRERGELSFSGAAADEARLIVCGLEGAMLVARPYGDIARFRAASVQLLMSLHHPATT